MATQTRKRIVEKLVALRKVHVVIPTDREESNELESDLRRMGCLGLWEKSWRVRSEDMVKELVTGGVDRIYASTIRGRPDRWNAEVWSQVYGFELGGEGMATKREDCTRDKFSQRLDPKYGYFVKDCKDERERRMLAFLVPIFSPEKPYNIILTLATTLLLAYSGKKVVDWGSIIGELVHKLATNTKRGLPSYIGPFLYHLYAHGNLLTDEEETQWTSHQFMRELQTTDSEPEMGHEGSKEEDMAEFSNEERTVTRKRKLTLENRPTRTRSATKPIGGGPSTFTEEDNPVDAIIRDLEGVRLRMTEYKLQVRRIGELVGNPPQGRLVAAVQDAIQDPHRLRELERKVSHLTAEKRKTAERVRKLEAEREKLLKQVKDTTLTVQKMSDMVHIPGSVWWKAKMFDVDLKNAGHVSGSKMVNFIMDQGSKMDATLRALKALIANCTEMFPGVVESSEEDESSSDYSDSTPRDAEDIQGAAAEDGNQPMEVVEHVEDITAITALKDSTSEVVVPNATLVSATVGKEHQGVDHMAEVTPPKLTTDFQVVARDPPPLAILAPEFPPSKQLSAPLAPEVAEAADRVGVIPGPVGHVVSVSPPRIPSLATDRADRHEGGSMHKKEAKLKKRKDRE